MQFNDSRQRLQDKFYTLAKITLAWAQWESWFQTDWLENQTIWWFPTPAAALVAQVAPDVSGRHCQRRPTTQALVWQSWFQNCSGFGWSEQWKKASCRVAWRHAPSQSKKFALKYAHDGNRVFRQIGFQLKQFNDSRLTLILPNWNKQFNDSCLIPILQFPDASGLDRDAAPVTTKSAQ